MGAIQLEKVRYTHDAMIDVIVAQPWISQGELARHFGYSESWISIVVNSDAFKERLAERKDDIVDPVLRSSLEERIRGVVDLSLQVLQDKLRATGNPNIAIRVLEHGSRALGYGARSAPTAVQVNTYVALVPPKSKTAAEWIANHTPEVVETAPGPQISHTVIVENGSLDPA